MKNRSSRIVRYVAAEKTQKERSAIELPVSFSDAEPDKEEIATLAQAYMNRILKADAEATPQSFGTEDEPPPAVNVASVQRSSLTSSNVVRFAQVQTAIPIFGSDMVVEIDLAGKLVSVQAEVASVVGTSPVPSLDAEAAKNHLATFLKSDRAALASIAEPTLTYFHDDFDDTGRWHLAWFVRSVPLAPPSDASHTKAGPRSHGPSPRQRNARFDYLVDAHDGCVVFHYSTTPCARAAAATAPIVPVRCRGKDALGQLCEFYATPVKGGFELCDPQRKLRTFDLTMGNIALDISEIALPETPIHSARADFSEASPAAISAHVNVAHVWDFYNNVLQRKSVDDEGMELISVVNCTSADDAGSDPNEWGNAIWWENRMWYGQTKEAKGNWRSLTTYLDIIGHELTHGVTERSSNLIYQGQSGALNESFSDIFGVIIQNWTTVGADSDVSKWSWEIGEGYGGHGVPLRDLSNPKRTGDPDHMNDFLKTREDAGGVHTNSNIHNKAAYRVLTAKDSNGDSAFSPREIAVLYYLCLVRLPQRATFSRVLRGLIDVATTYYAGDPDERDRKVRAIRTAYEKVGITLEAS